MFRFTKTLNLYLMDSYKAFDKQWFQRHQSKLLWFLQFKLFRKALHLPDGDIVQLLPNSYTLWLGGNKFQTDFRTHDKYSKRLYNAFKPLWWAMHIWDLAADPLLPKLSFGFDTLTSRPDANPETSTVDGNIIADNHGTWANARNATDGTSTNDSDTVGEVCRAESGAVYAVMRSFYLFDTSALTSAATISAAVLSIASWTGGGKTDTDSSDIDIVSSNPASNTALSNADFDQVGSTVYSSISIASWSTVDATYNDFTLDANGRSNVSKTGISKFAARCSRDTDNTTPTGMNRAHCYFAEQTGTTRDPKLVITYTTVVDPNLPSVSDIATATENVNITQVQNINLDALQRGVKIIG